MTLADQGAQFLRDRRIPEALRKFEASALAGEDQRTAALERWLTYMLAGEFELAWRESDRVLAFRRTNGETCGHLPEHQRWLWDGSPIAGRHVLVRCYHGLGDTIQFARLIPKLQDVCHSVSFLPQPELQELIPSTKGDGEPGLEIELMEVPHALRLTLADIPPPELSLIPSAPIPQQPSSFRLGLAWASGGWRPERSVPLSLFQFLNEIPNLELIGLQRGPATLQLPPDGPVFHQADWPNTSVAETARTIRNLDLVITTDTMVAHLAGALRIPVWTLLHWNADWRWLHGRDDSPWYPDMRLFRQAVPDAWEEVITRVRLELADQLEKVDHQQAQAGTDA